MRASIKNCDRVKRCSNDPTGQSESRAFSSLQVTSTADRNGPPHETLGTLGGLGAKTGSFADIRYFGIAHSAGLLMGTPGLHYLASERSQGPEARKEHRSMEAVGLGQKS